MTTENSKGMKDVGTSNISHVSKNPLQCIQVTTPYAGHVVEVTFRSHYNAYDLFSNKARLSSSLFNGEENNDDRKHQIECYTYFQWTEDRQGFQIQYLTLDT